MNSLLRELGYTLDTKNDIWMKPSYKDISYSDGDEVEKRIDSIIDQASDLCVLSAELNQHCTDWPSSYHLSPHRANIMRPFKSLLTGDTLEIGAGCGAITRYLGECGGRVLAIEGSSHRAAIVRSRTRDLKNVTVLAEDFNQFQCARKFDVVTLIGVFEYANLFAPTQNPHLALLEHVYSLLKPKGKLIIAIENQLGLKYFAGFPEDHVGLPMYGLEGRYQKNQAQTFGKTTLSNLLKEAKFENLVFFVPCPDYKLPHSILTEQGLKNKEFDAAVFAWQNVWRDAQIPGYRNFNLELAWPEIFKNELSIDLANSFLIVASPSSGNFIDPSILAYHYSTSRKPMYCKETLFKYRKKVNVYYAKLSGDSAEDKTRTKEEPPIKFAVPASSEYISGSLLAFDFVKIVTRDGWTFDEVAEFVQRYLQIIQDTTQSHDTQFDFTSLHTNLPGKLFDMTPHNIIIKQDGQPSIIDQEWVLDQPIELGYLLLRSFMTLMGFITIFGLHESGVNMNYRQLIDSTLSVIALDIQEKDYARYITLETEVLNFITNYHKSEEDLSDWLMRDLPILDPNKSLLDHDSQIKNLNQEISKRDAQIRAILSSSSWWLTKPLRFLGRLVRGRFREAFASFKHLLNFNHTSIRKKQTEEDTVIAIDKSDESNLLIRQIKFDELEGKKFIPYRTNKKIDPCVKLIAFYLPQYHPIPENDLFWGKGFTDWNNVGKALPNYTGHYQPHCPIHLGYYDLRIPEVMEEQAKLAKEYGIYGFAYYFYWFDGKSVMEKPLEAMLENSNVDIPFFLLWANENWTRRWDGGNQGEVLLSQNHSIDDSIAFIRHVIKYFKDDRYIRIDNKPVLAIYKADLIPNIKIIITKWRNEVKKYGISDLYVTCAKTTGFQEAQVSCFDAVMEFPPHLLAPGRADDMLSITNSSYQGIIGDYGDFVKLSVQQNEPSYKLFKTTMLSWDNTARRQNNSYIFHGFSLLKYKQWLSLLCNRVFNSPKYNSDEKLVFINAWNEWAEGTHLEPDREFGYGYLQATYDAISNYDAKTLSMIKGHTLVQKSDIAVLIHVHYMDIWPSISDSLKQIRQTKFDLYITVTSSCIIERILSEYPDAHIKLVDNRGRDILPFLKMMGSIASLGYTAICKAHLKKSAHRVDGDGLRNYLYASLLNNIVEIAKKFTDDQFLGMLVPKKLLIPHTQENMKFNHKNVSSFCNDLKIPFTDDIFPAGSMFWFRPKALSGIEKISERNFDFEDGYCDGRLTDAVERIFCLLTKHNGYKVDTI